VNTSNICPNCGCDIDEVRKMLPDWTTCEELGIKPLEPLKPEGEIVLDNHVDHLSEENIVD